MDWNRPCSLLADIYMAPSENWSIKWSTKRRSYPYLPSLDQIEAELRHLSQHGTGVPASIAKNSQGKEHLCLYGSRYLIGLYPSLCGDGYTLAYIEPQHLRAHETLADGVLMVKGPRYIVCPVLSAIPKDNTNYWNFLRQEWAELEREKYQHRTKRTQSPQEITLQHKNYLAMLEQLIQIKYQLERDKYNLSAPIPYLRVESAGEQRNARQDIYVFQLIKPHHALSEKFLLRIQGMQRSTWTHLFYRENEANSKI